MRTAFVVALLLLTSSDVRGQSVCGTREVLLKQLAAGYQEAPIGMGLADGGAVLELLVGPSGSWSLISTRPGGPTCLIGTGEGWQGARCEPVKPEERDS